MDECVKKITDAGHWACVEAVHKTLLARADNKKYVVWMKGEASTGKSKFCQQLSQILNCQKVTFHADHITWDSPTDHRYKTQVAISPELKIWAAFGSKNISTTLQLFEGEGADLSPNKFQPIINMFKGTYFVIASNEFPREGQIISECHWTAVKTRCNFVELERTHLGTEQFPYGPGHLAMALNSLSNKWAVYLDQQAAIHLQASQEEAERILKVQVKEKQKEPEAEEILKMQEKAMPDIQSASQPSGWKDGVLMQQPKDVYLGKR